MTNTLPSNFILFAFPSPNGLTKIVMFDTQTQVAAEEEGMQHLLTNNQLAKLTVHFPSVPNGIYKAMAQLENFRAACRLYFGDDGAIVTYLQG